MLKTTFLQLFTTCFIVIATLYSCESKIKSTCTLYSLQCESLTNPMGINNSAPRFNWKIKSDQSEQEQTAYQIIVASNEEMLNEKSADVWNSGKTISSQSLYIPFNGEKLISSKKYFWKVKVWDKNDVASAWSEINYFSTGKLSPKEWKAKWIGAYFEETYEPKWEAKQWIGTGKENHCNAYYRKEFQLEDVEKIEKAIIRWHSTKRAILYINGILVKESDHWVGSYEIDIDFWLKKGKNVMAIHAKDVDNNEAKIAAHVWIEYANGEKLNFRTDNTWKAKPITAAEEWYHPFFYDDNWNNAIITSAKASKKNPRKGMKSICLRKDISVENKVKNAIVHISGLGAYEFYINGQKVGNEFFTPGWTEYDVKVEYQTFEVGHLLHEGENSLGIMLGNSWWEFHLNNFKNAGIDTSLKAIMQLEIESVDGKIQQFVTDESWKAAPSAIESNTIYHGEVIDFRNEMKDWQQVGFDDSEWKNVYQIKYDIPLIAHQAEPITVTEKLLPKKISKTSYGSYIVDFGQNIAGWISLSVPTKETSKILVRYSELIYDDGSLNTASLRSAKSINKYFLTGNETKELEPHFTYHGFRFVEVFGYPEEISNTNIVAKVVHTNLDQSGHFKCSNPLFNKIFENEVWTFRDNYYAVPTDCPQRDERLGWMADAGNIPVTACYFFNVNSYFQKWVNDMKDIQERSGHFPDFAPNMSGNDYGSNIGAPGWADAGIKVPYTLFKFYGDTSVLEENYAAMKKHVDYVISRSENNLYMQAGWGDWLATNPSPSEPFGTAYHYQSTQTLAKVASILGYKQQAHYYDSISNEISKAYHAKYYNTVNEYYVNGSQSMNILPVNFGITPPELKKATVDKVTKDILAHEKHITTGFLGTSLLFPTLSEFGYNDLIYDVLDQRDFPSYGRIIEAGATTHTEAWNAYIGPDFGSHNHFNLGSVNRWYFEGLAGIRPLEEFPGFKKFIIKPIVVDKLDFVDVTYESGYGTIASSWKKENGKLSFNIEIPVNTTAMVYLHENVKTDASVPLKEDEKGQKYYELGSGNYIFSN